MREEGTRLTDPLTEHAWDNQGTTTITELKTQVALADTILRFEVGLNLRLRQSSCLLLHVFRFFPSFVFRGIYYLEKVRNTSLRLARHKNLASCDIARYRIFRQLFTGMNSLESLFQTAATPFKGSVQI